MSDTTSCVFCDIISGLAPASVVHRDESCIAFMDIQPVNAGHLLAVCRQADSSGRGAEQCCEPSPLTSERNDDEP